MRVLGLVSFLLVNVCFFGEELSKGDVNTSLERVVVLSGRLILKRFCGPPEYSSIEDGDRIDDCWVLQLDKGSLDILESVADQVLLALDEDMNVFCLDHANDGVVVEGFIFHAHTAHHYTPILIDVKNMRVSNDR